MQSRALRLGVVLFLFSLPCLQAAPSPKAEEDDLALAQWPQALVKKRKYVCKICGRRFRFKSAMTRHLRDVHQEQSFPCRHCRAHFTSRAEMRRHSAQVHLKKGPFICTFCNHAFTQKGHLNRHMWMVHQQKKPFVCEQCSGTFAQRSTLKVHVDTMHRGLRPFVCMWCTQAFGQKQSLTLHVKRMHAMREQSRVDEGGFARQPDLQQSADDRHSGDIVFLPEHLQDELPSTAEEVDLLFDVDTPVCSDPQAESQPLAVAPSFKDVEMPADLEALLQQDLMMEPDALFVEEGWNIVQELGAD
ncbi:MAG: C2H2-type zinc finger protein [Zetaproteobacteria bacterium]|nr:C2H2-type zinc finger protein [Zetaproteobacteria bacterium]